MVDEGLTMEAELTYGIFVMEATIGDKDVLMET